MDCPTCAQPCSNTHPCPCGNTGCARHGRCCDCIASHLLRGSLPVCARETAKKNS